LPRPPGRGFAWEWFLKLRLRHSLRPKWIYGTQEAFGKTIAESIMCNTPVISSDNISSKEIISHKENGYLVDNDNYSDAIKWIYENLNKNIKEINILKSKKFTLKEISSQYIRLYSEILKKNYEL